MFPRLLRVPALVDCDRRPDQHSYLRMFPLFLSFFPQCFLVPLCVFPMDPLLCPEYLLLLEQGERSLEGHTRLFQVLANLSVYPDDALCAFDDASLNFAYRAHASRPPSHPLLSLPALSSGSPSARPQPTPRLLLSG